MNCPKCNSTLTKEHINVQTDLAHCSNCNHVFNLSSHVANTLLGRSFDINKPPKGAWLKPTVNGLALGASLKSSIAFFMVPFMLVWSGVALGGIYGTQLAKGKFDLFLSLFGVPFLLGALFFWGITFLFIWGKITISISKHGGEIFTGIGKFGKKQPFVWSEIDSVKEGISGYSSKGRTQTMLFFEGQKRIKFGWGLKAERRYYLMKALEDILNRIKTKKSLL